MPGRRLKGIWVAAQVIPERLHGLELFFEGHLVKWKSRGHEEIIARGELRRQSPINFSTSERPLPSPLITPTLFSRPPHSPSPGEEGEQQGRSNRVPLTAR